MNKLGSCERCVNLMLYRVYYRVGVYYCTPAGQQQVYELTSFFCVKLKQHIHINFVSPCVLDFSNKFIFQHKMS